MLAAQHLRRLGKFCCKVGCRLKKGVGMLSWTTWPDAAGSQGTSFDCRPSRRLKMAAASASLRRGAGVDDIQLAHLGFRTSPETVTAAHKIPEGNLT